MAHAIVFETLTQDVRHVLSPRPAMCKVQQPVGSSHVTGWLIANV